MIKFLHQESEIRILEKKDNYFLNIIINNNKNIMNAHSQFNILLEVKYY